MGNSTSATQTSISSQSSVLEKNSSKTEAAGEKPKCKACCACPETKKLRDEWYANYLNI